jgi:hypothetical protein
MAKIYFTLHTNELPTVSWDAGKGIFAVFYETKEAAAPIPAGPRLLTAEELAKGAPIPDMLSQPAPATAAPGGGSTAENIHVDYGRTILGGGISNQNDAE